MALFIPKPILWNTYHYLRPSGVIATSGYPRESGYGRSIRSVEEVVCQVTTPLGYLPLGGQGN